MDENEMKKNTWKTMFESGEKIKQSKKTLYTQEQWDREIGWGKLPNKYRRHDMKCYHCSTELIWGGDEDIDKGEGGDEGFYANYDIITNLSCPECDSYVEVYSKNNR